MIRRLAALVLLALLVTGLLASCSGRGGRGSTSRVPRTAEDSLAFWRARADSLDGALGSLERVEGRFVQPLGTSTWVAWFEGGDVRVVHEELSLGERGSKSDRYYFERGVPRLAVESGRVPADSTLRLVPVERAILFDDAGQLVAASKTVDGVKTWLVASEATGTLSRARDLLESARAARPDQGAAPPAGGGTPAPR